MSNYYSYKELRENALAQGATAEDRLELFNWMESHAICEWNGESFNIDDGLYLYPLYDEAALENGEAILVDAEVRS